MRYTTDVVFDRVTELMVAVRDLLTDATDREEIFDDDRKIYPDWKAVMDAYQQLEEALPYSKKAIHSFLERQPSFTGETEVSHLPKEDT